MFKQPPRVEIPRLQAARVLFMRGGFLLVYDASIVLRGCVLLDGYSDHYVRGVRAACGVGESHVGVVGRARRVSAWSHVLSNGSPAMMLPPA